MADFKRGCFIFHVGSDICYFGSEHTCKQRTKDDIYIGNFDEMILFLEKKVFKRSLSELELHHKIIMSYICRFVSQASVALPLKMLQGYFAVQDGQDLFSYTNTRHIGPDHSYVGGSTQFDFMFTEQGSPQLFIRREALEMRELSDNIEEFVEDSANSQKCILNVLVKPMQRYNWSVSINVMETS